MYEIRGRVKSIGATKSYGAGGFKKRDLIIVNESGARRQVIAIQFMRDHLEMLDEIKDGDEVKVGFVVEGREWTSPQGEVRHFTDLHGLMVEVMPAAEESEAGSGIIAPSAAEGEMPF